MTFDNPKIEIAYIYVNGGKNSDALLGRFLESYYKFYPGYSCDVTVVANGGIAKPILEKVLENADFILPRVNDAGWDVSAYLDMADRTQADLLVCLGESTHFWKDGWLSRIAEAYCKFGPGMYGFFSSFLVRPHLNTTAFCVSPKFLRQYPAVRDRRERYQFEHGQQALWRRIARRGYPVKLVTVDGEYDEADWRKPDNIMWRGDQSNCLVRCHHLDKWDEAREDRKRGWSMGADGFWPVKTENPRLVNAR